MAVKSQQELDSFKNTALQQGYDPAEVESFMGIQSICTGGSVST